MNYHLNSGEYSLTHRIGDEKSNEKDDCGAVSNLKDPYLQLPYAEKDEVANSNDSKVHNHITPFISSEEEGTNNGNSLEKRKVEREVSNSPSNSSFSIAGTFVW